MSTRNGIHLIAIYIADHSFQDRKDLQRKVIWDMMEEIHVDLAMKLRDRYRLQNDPVVWIWRQSDKERFLLRLDWLRWQNNVTHIDFVFVGHGRPVSGDWDVQENCTITADEVCGVLARKREGTTITIWAFNCHSHRWSSHPWPQDISFCPASTPEMAELFGYYNEEEDEVDGMKEYVEWIKKRIGNN